MCSGASTHMNKVFCGVGQKRKREDLVGAKNFQFQAFPGPTNVKDGLGTHLPLQLPLLPPCLHSTLVGHVFFLTLRQLKLAVFVYVVSFACIMPSLIISVAGFFELFKSELKNHLFSRLSSLLQVIFLIGHFIIWNDLLKAFTYVLFTSSYQNINSMRAENWSCLP